MNCPTQWTEKDRHKLRIFLEHDKEANRIRKPDPAFRKEMEWGWLLPMMLELEEPMWGRWDYWFRTQFAGKLLDDPIPQIEFADSMHSQTLKMLDATLNCIPNYGEWRGWSSETNFRYFLEWLLFGFGHNGHKAPPVEPAGCEGASSRMYQVFNLGLMLLHPYDYLGDIAADMRYGRGAGFFPTPMNICKMMCMMTFDDRDGRAETVCDPCFGTGRMPLLASNHSLRLYGQDINQLMVYSTLVNGYFYAPWLVKPIGWLDGREGHGAEISRALTEAAPPHIAEMLRGSLFDEEEQWQYEPIIKRTLRPGEPPTRPYPPLFGRK